MFVLEASDASATFLRYPINQATAFLHVRREIQLLAGGEDESLESRDEKEDEEIFSSPFPSD